MKAKKTINKRLRGAPDVEVLDDGGLRGNFIEFVNYQPGDTTVMLEGDFDATKLRAIARHIDKHAGYLKQYEKRTGAKGKGL